MSIITQPFSNKAAYVTIQGYFENPLDHKRSPFKIKCLVDTGFNAGIYASKTHVSDAQLCGLAPLLTQIRLGDGSKVPAHLSLAYIDKINNLQLPLPGIKVQFFMRGKEFNYLGMEALCNWVTEFDGPHKLLTIKT